MAANCVLLCIVPRIVARTIVFHCELRHMIVITNYKIKMRHEGIVPLMTQPALIDIDNIGETHFPIDLCAKFFTGFIDLLEDTVFAMVREAL